MYSFVNINIYIYTQKMFIVIIHLMDLK